ncbi:hypothetical protein [Burkholderia sp. NLJ2]|uniref:hypothetical protein n=1 Tax=Burkholderia sp. NLJ2 TaxID=3090699 RepID=UPI003C6C60DF
MIDALRVYLRDAGGVHVRLAKDRRADCCQAFHFVWSASSRRVWIRRWPVAASHGCGRQTIAPTNPAKMGDDDAER